MANYVPGAVPHADKLIPQLAFLAAHLHSTGLVSFGNKNSKEKTHKSSIFRIPSRGLISFLKGRNNLKKLKKISIFIIYKYIDNFCT